MVEHGGRRGGRIIQGEGSGNEAILGQSPSSVRTHILGSMYRGGSRIFEKGGGPS